MTKVTKLYKDLHVRLEKYTKVLSGQKSRLYWDITFDDQPYDAFVVTGAKHKSRDPVCTHIWIKPANAQQDDAMYPYDGFSDGIKWGISITPMDICTTYGASAVIVGSITRNGETFYDCVCDSHEHAFVVMKQKFEQLAKLKKTLTLNSNVWQRKLLERRICYKGVFGRIACYDITTGCLTIAYSEDNVGLAQHKGFDGSNNPYVIVADLFDPNIEWGA